MRRAGEKDIKKIMELIWEQIKKLTAKDVGALPDTGGTITSALEVILNLKNTGDGTNAGLGFEKGGKHIGHIFMSETTNGFYIWCNAINSNLLRLSPEFRQIYDYKTKSLKEILVDEPLVYKEAKIKLNDVNDGMVVLGKNGSNTTDITDIIRKANTLQEGMIFARISNRMGYIIFQNFRIDCTKLTDDERVLIQSFTSIVVRKSNNSVDYPTLIPANVNETMDCQITSKTGYSFESVKVTMRSNSTNSEIEYNMPSKFRNDDNSQNNLAFYTDKWATMFGADIKER